MRWWRDTHTHTHTKKLSTSYSHTHTPALIMHATLTQTDKHTHINSSHIGEDHTSQANSRHMQSVWCCIKPSHQNASKMTPKKKKSFHKVRFLNLLIQQKNKQNQNLWVNCVKTGQHNKTLLPASFTLATEVHLSLLLFLQRGPPRFNWVLMESKSPLPLQPLELDMLIPPQSALGFLPAAWRTVILCKVAMKPAGQMDGGSWTPPAKPGRWQRKRDTWGETLTWLCSHRCGKSSREPRAIRPPSQFHGAIIPSGPHLHFNW